MSRALCHDCSLNARLLSTVTQDLLTPYRSGDQKMGQARLADGPGSLRLSKERSASGSECHTCRVEIRQAHSDEWQLSRDVRLRSLADAPDAFCSSLETERAFDEEAWRSRLDRAHTVFAWEGDAVVGAATGKPDPHEAGGHEIVGMWVDPAHRRGGVATALIDELVRRARDAGASSVALWVADGNERAQRLYEKCGFSATGQRDTMRPGVDEVRMRLPLV